MQIPSTWTPTQQQLWERIRRFDLNAECPSNARWQFVQKLADEQNWPLDRARRTIEEYRRFAFLAVVAEHSVSPSDAVDQAWHQHILDTRSYQRFCSEVLGRPLHHVPSRAAPGEAETLADSYGRTVGSYRAFFGAEPPSDIWPSPEERTRLGDGHHQRLDRSRHWVIERAAIATALRQAAVAALALAAAAGLLFALRGFVGRSVEPLASSPTASFGLRPVAALEDNPLDWSGQQFLLFYVVASLVALVVAGIARHLLRRPSGSPDPTAGELGLYETAMLAGEEPAVISTAAIALQERGVLKLSAEGDRLLLNGDAALLDKPKHIVEQGVVHSVAAGAGKASELQYAVRHELEELRTRLKQDGLLVPDAEAWTARLVPLALALTVPLFGAMKIDVGLSRGKPVFILVALVAIGSLIALTIFLRRPFRSRRGSRLLSELQTRHAALQNAPATAVGVPSQAGLSPAVPIALGVALFGTAALVGSGYEPMRSFLQPIGGGGDSGWSSGCGGDSGGGDGGGGGGGCGGCGGGGD